MDISRRVSICKLLDFMTQNPQFATRLGAKDVSSYQYFNDKHETYDVKELSRRNKDGAYRRSF